MSEHPRGSLFQSKVATGAVETVDAVTKSLYSRKTLSVYRCGRSGRGGIGLGVVFVRFRIPRRS